MTPHRFTAAVLVVVLSAAAGVACSSDDTSEADASSTAESAFCQRSIESNVAALTFLDDSDPEPTCVYSDAVVAFLAARVEDAPTGRGISTAPPIAVVSRVDRVAVTYRPISVADAYHGVGVMFCLDRNPMTVADAYHGVGLAVCV
jgi:hypothetical protein